MMKKLSLFPHKVQTCQQLHDGDFVRRVRSCKWPKGKADEDPDFLGNFIASDELIFLLDGTANRQKYKILGK